MLHRLPEHLIRAILLLSVAVATEDGTRSSSALDSVETDTPPTGTPLTLWDLGFSLREKWADLREEEACPIPPSDIILSDEVPVPKKQAVLEHVAASLHPSESSTTLLPITTGNATPETADDFVSFEDWKRKKLEEDGEPPDDEVMTETAAQLASDTRTVEPNHSSKETGSPNVNDSKSSPKSSTGSQSNITDTPQKPAHKYNYASPDCSARIHSSSPLTQHASSLLHKSRDRYMLTPCKADEHWVVVELCDEIRIEAVEVAVWEFFSGVVREVRVSVGGEDDDDGEDYPENDVQGRSSKWEEVGAFVGKNVRGVQTFTLSRPTAFHRFIRLDFPSYYGSEYYCPVSQLKVYGMNQMEAFKWEQKRIAASAKEKDKERSSKDRELEDRRGKEKQEEEKRAKEEQEREDAKREKELGELERLVREQARRAGGQPELSTFDETTIETSATEPKTTVTTATVTTASDVVPTEMAVNSSSDNMPNNTNSTTTTYSRSAPPRSDSSESIYAFIIRRLNALEGNSSLVARYVEEQTKVMRLMLGRVETGWDEWKLDHAAEDRRRWEQERMRQEDRLGRVLSQMEQQRIAMDLERRAILAQLRVLGDEIGYERRRGFAQLFITLFILVLGVATRSSTIDAVLKPLMTEARRRRSIYRKSISGPLSGLKIDMSSVVDESQRPLASPSGEDVRDSPAPYEQDVVEHSPSPTPIAATKKSSSGSISRSNSTRRPTTPLRRRQLHQAYRSFSESVPLAVFPLPRSGGQSPQPKVSAQKEKERERQMKSDSRPTSPISRPRISLPARPTAHVHTLGHGHGQGQGQKRLARSAHLHTIEADKVRDRARAEPPLTSSLGQSPDLSNLPSPFVNQTISADTDATSPARPERERETDGEEFAAQADSVSPLTGQLLSGVFDHRMTVPISAEEEDRSDWGTDVGSASEAEEEVAGGGQ